MPSPNKFAKLDEVGYRIAPVCRICLHFSKTGTLSDWGHCNLCSYRHEKHGDHPLGVHELGSCKHWIFSPDKAQLMGNYIKFLSAENGKRA